jgi:hypothetical protein
MQMIFLFNGLGIIGFILFNNGITNFDILTPSSGSIVGAGDRTVICYVSLLQFATIFQLGKNNFETLAHGLLCNHGLHLFPHHNEVMD